MTTLRKSGQNVGQDEAHSYGRRWMGECPDCDDSRAAHVAGLHNPKGRAGPAFDHGFRLYIINNELLVIVPPHDEGRADAQRMVREWRDRHGLAPVRWVVMPQGTTVTDLREHAVTATAGFEHSPDHKSCVRLVER